jgi:hypothetical protein
MLALNRQHLNMESTLINVLKTSASIISIYLHAILSENTPRYFTWLTKDIIRPFNVRRCKFLYVLVALCRERTDYSVFVTKRKP